MVCLYCACFVFFFFKQKTAYEMRISDWSSDVCSSDLAPILSHANDGGVRARMGRPILHPPFAGARRLGAHDSPAARAGLLHPLALAAYAARDAGEASVDEVAERLARSLQVNRHPGEGRDLTVSVRSEEHTSELQSLMRISYAVFCLKKKRHRPTQKQR